MDESLLGVPAIAFSVLAVATILAGTMVRRIFLSDDRITRKAGFNPATGKKPDAGGLRSLMVHWFTWNIISWALFEAVALYGLVLYVTGGGQLVLGISCVVSALCILLNPPDAGRIKSLMGI